MAIVESSSTIAETCRSYAAAFAAKEFEPSAKTRWFIKREGVAQS